MKNIVMLGLYCIAALFAPITYPATLHVLLVADSTDATIGAGTKENDRKLRAWFGNAAARLHMTPDFRAIEDKKFSCGAISTAVGSMTAKADDVIVFYYSGHGFRTETATSRFPDFYCGADAFSADAQTQHAAGKGGAVASTHPFCSTDSFDPYCSLDGVALALRNKGARLTLAFADTCNRIVPISASVVIPTAAAFAGDMQLTQLFLHSKGTLTMSGSVPNQYSWYLPSGGFFTSQLLDALNKSIDPSRAGTWSEVVDLATVDIVVDPNSAPPTIQQPQAASDIS